MHMLENENTGETIVTSSENWKVWQCEVCGWIYDEAKGWPEEGIAAGTRWKDIPDDWTCPECQASKKDFIMVEIRRPEVAADEVTFRQPAEASGFADQPVVIIGTGLAGYNLVKEIRGNGDSSRIMMITADDGSYYPKPVLSNGLGQNKSGIEIVKHSAAEMAAEYKIEILTHVRVENIATASHQLTLDNGSCQSYRKLVLATGARPITPDLGTGAKNSVFQVNNLDDYIRFRDALENKSKLLVIGAGLIGCEFANDLANAGKKVSVVDTLDGPLASLLPGEASAAVREGLEGVGIEFHLGRLVRQVDSAGDGIRATLDNGEHIEADLGLVAIGIAPDLSLARKTGLATKRGIVVNRFLETSEINIFAIGDAAEIDDMVLPFVMPLMAQAQALAHTLTDINTMVDYGVMPVHVKTPAVPVIAYCVEGNDPGRWDIERDGANCKALYRTEAGELRGIALTGSFVVEKNDYMELLPRMIAEDDFRLPNAKDIPDDFYNRPRSIFDTLRHAWWGV